MPLDLLVLQNLVDRDLPKYGLLKLFAIHARSRKSCDGGQEYHKTKWRVYEMTDTSENCRREAGVYCKAIEWAQERDRIIANANDTAQRL